MIETTRGEREAILDGRELPAGGLCTRTAQRLLAERLITADCGAWMRYDTKGIHLVVSGPGRLV